MFSIDQVDSVCEYSRNMAKVDPYGCWNGAVGDGVAGDEELENILGSILDFPDFPMESLEGDGLVGDWDASKSQYLGPIPMDVLMGTPSMPETKIDMGPPVFMHRPVSLVSYHHSKLSLIDLHLKYWSDVMKFEFARSIFHIFHAC